MKRLFLTMVAVLSMTMTFAENENAASLNSTEAYNMTVNMKKLSKALGLTTDQVESVAEIHKTFAAEMMSFGLQHTRLPCLLKLMSIESLMSSSHLT